MLSHEQGSSAGAAIAAPALSRAALAHTWLPAALRGHGRRHHPR
jgi:hypothetical protein